jgi:hypothetical protein
VKLKVLQIALNSCYFSIEKGTPSPRLNQRLNIKNQKLGKLIIGFFILGNYIMIKNLKTNGEIRMTNDEKPHIVYLTTNNQKLTTEYFCYLIFSILYEEGALALVSHLEHKDLWDIAFIW